MLASALSMGSGAYLATKTEREVQEAELRRESKELQIHPEEEEEELALFYQLKGVPEDEAKMLASRLIAQPESALKTLGSEELGLSEQSFPNPLHGGFVCHALNRHRSIHSDHSVFLRQRLRSHHRFVCDQHTRPFHHRRVQDHCDRFKSMEERRGDDHHRIG